MRYIIKYPMSVESISLHSLTLKRRNSEENEAYLGRKRRLNGQLKEDDVIEEPTLIKTAKSKDAAAAKPKDVAKAKYKDPYSPKHKDTSSNEKVFTQAEVNALLHKQEHTFRILLENKLKEQYNAFNKLYIEHIFKENTHEEISYIS